MSSEVATNETFEQRMKNKIRGSIGDMMTDEDLQKLIDASMHDVFFKERKDYERTNSYNTIYKQPFIEEVLNEVLAKKVEEQIKEYMENHAQEITDHIKKRVDEGLSKLALDSFDKYIGLKFNDIGYNIVNDIQQAFNNHNNEFHNTCH